MKPLLALLAYGVIATLISTGIYHLVLFVVLRGGRVSEPEALRLARWCGWMMGFVFTVIGIRMLVQLASGR